jgi:hypothetical protein
MKVPNLSLFCGNIRRTEHMNSHNYIHLLLCFVSIVDLRYFMTVFFEVKENFSTSCLEHMTYRTVCLSYWNFVKSFPRFRMCQQVCCSINTSLLCSRYMYIDQLLMTVESRCSESIMCCCIHLLKTLMQKTHLVVRTGCVWLNTDVAVFAILTLESRHAWHQLCPIM